MNKQEISQIIVKRSCGITTEQWHDFLLQLEKFGLYLIICSKTQGMSKSPVGGFIPLPSKDDEFRLMTVEELQELGLQAEHQILPYQKAAQPQVEA